MAQRPWDEYITARDREVYRLGGFGHEGGFGIRPAILVIDVQYRTCGERPMPILEAIKQYATACGEEAWEAVYQIRELLDIARPKGFPVIYARGERKDAFEGARYGEKIPSLTDAANIVGSRGVEIVDEVAPQPGDILISKRFPSIFFGTPLITFLVNLDVDTVIVTGCTTSGCVRGTVVDAISYGFKAVIPEKCVWDRGLASHAINLFDMDQKYADVLPLSDVKAALEKLPAREVRKEVAPV